MRVGCVSDGYAAINLVDVLIQMDYRQAFINDLHLLVLYPHKAAVFYYLK